MCSFKRSLQHTFFDVPWFMSLQKLKHKKIEMQFHSSRNCGLKRKLKHNGTMQARAYEIRYKPAELSKVKSDLIQK